MQLSVIWSCAQEMWRPGLGDPSIGGLGLTVLYIVASVLLLRVALGRGTWAPRERLLWSAATVILLLLTVNKQLDLQSYLNSIGRCVADYEGLGRQRGGLHRELGAVILALGLAGTLVLLRACRPVLAQNWRLILGLGMLAIYLGLQVARFEQMTGWLGQAIATLKLHRVLEGSALLVLIWSALRRLREA